MQTCAVDVVDWMPVSLVRRQLQTLALIHQKLRTENYYWKVGYYGLITAGTVHFGFLLLFLWLELYVLAAVNVVSVLIYWYCVFGLGLKVLQARDDGVIGWWVFIELLGHNVIATWYLGADAGFQYYVYMLAALPFFTLTYSTLVYLFRVASVVCVAVTLSMYSVFQYPKVEVGQLTLRWMNGMNMVIAFTALVLLFYLYAREEKAFHNALLNKQKATEFARKHVDDD